MHVKQRQELVSFRLISVLQNSIQPNAPYDFGLWVDYQD